MLYTGKFWWGKTWRIWQIMSYLLKFSSSVFTDTPKIYLAYVLTVAFLPKFLLLPVWFAKLFPCQIFPMYGRLEVNHKVNFYQMTAYIYLFTAIFVQDIWLLYPTLRTTKNLIKYCCEVKYRDIKST